MNEIQWFCQHCDTEIGLIARDGWIQTTVEHNTPCQWEVTCTRCDNNPHANYPIDAVRVTTYNGFDGLHEWTRHLNVKTWSNPHSWQHIIHHYSTATQ